MPKVNCFVQVVALVASQMQWSMPFLLKPKSKLLWRLSLALAPINMRWTQVLPTLTLSLWSLTPACLLIWMTACIQWTSTRQQTAQTRPAPCLSTHTSGQKVEGMLITAQTSTHPHPSYIHIRKCSTFPHKRCMIIQDIAGRLTLRNTTPHHSTPAPSLTSTVSRRMRALTYPCRAHL